MNARRSILIGWELGGGFGHLVRLAPIIDDLLARRWRVVLAVTDVAKARFVFARRLDVADPSVFRLFPAPIIPHRLGPSPAAQPLSIAEILAGFGLVHTAVVRPLVNAWRAIVQETAPDIVLVDSAPMLAAAVRGRIPLAAVGNGWAMPPPGPRVPLLPFKGADAVAAARAEERIVAAFEAVVGGPARGGLADILRGDVNFVCAPKLLDPYHPWRREPLHWPPELAVEAGSRSRRDGPALVYLPATHPGQAQVIAAHDRAAIPAVAWLGGATADGTPNVSVREAPIDFAAELPTARHIVHHGGLGVAAWALALGVPQLVLPNDLEKHVVGQALAAAGAGVALSARASAESVARGIEALSRLEPCAIARIPPAEHDALATRLAITEACEGLAARAHERSAD
jgi:hypothetical protein